MIPLQPEENFALPSAVFRNLLLISRKSLPVLIGTSFALKRRRVTTMIRIERILCPTDLSTESDEALRYAVALARIYQAKLLLLHCNEQDSSQDEDDEQKVKSHRERLFIESLVPHLGIATVNELDWQGLVRTSVSPIGNTIVREAVDGGEMLDAAFGLRSKGDWLQKPANQQQSGNNPPGRH